MNIVHVLYFIITVFYMDVYFSIYPFIL